MVVMFGTTDNDKPVVAKKYETGPIEMTKDLAMFKRGPDRTDSIQAKHMRAVERH